MCIYIYIYICMWPEIARYTTSKITACLTLKEYNPAFNKKNYRLPRVWSLSYFNLH